MEALLYKFWSILIILSMRTLSPLPMGENNDFITR